MPKRFSSSFQRRVLPRVRRVSGSFRASDERRLQGCLVRFRPMRMTIVPAMLGAVPIAIGYGAGGEARQPLGLVVVGGILSSQLATSDLTPVVCTYLSRPQDVFHTHKRDELFAASSLSTSPEEQQVPSFAYPPAIAPMTSRGSRPSTTASGRSVSGGSFDKSLWHA